jgi:hypothetical protein
MRSGTITVRLICGYCRWIMPKSSVFHPWRLSHKFCRIVVVPNRIMSYLIDSVMPQSVEKWINQSVHHCISQLTTSERKYTRALLSSTATLASNSANAAIKRATSSLGKAPGMLQRCVTSYARGQSRYNHETHDLAIFCNNEPADNDVVANRFLITALFFCLEGLFRERRVLRTPPSGEPRRRVLRAWHNTPRAYARHRVPPRAEPRWSGQVRQHLVGEHHARYFLVWFSIGYSAYCTKLPISSFHKMYSTSSMPLFVLCPSFKSLKSHWSYINKFTKYSTYFANHF